MQRAANQGHTSASTNANANKGAARKKLEQGSRGLHGHVPKSCCGHAALNKTRQ
jgi:hypothetical protein